MSADQLPASGHLHGAILQEDWNDDFDDARDAVDHLLRTSSFGPALAAEPRRLLATDLTEAPLDLFFEKELKSNFTPKLDGFTWRSFLQWIIDRSAEVHRDDDPGGRTP